MKLQPRKLQEDGVHIRAVRGHMLPDINCPFCGGTAEVSMIMGKVVFSAIVGDEELCDAERVSLAGFICTKAHLFFVLETDMAATLAGQAA